jgi:hypothetical protein
MRITSSPESYKSKEINDVSAPQWVKFMDDFLLTKTSENFVECLRIGLTLQFSQVVVLVVHEMFFLN